MQGVKYTDSKPIKANLDRVSASIFDTKTRAGVVGVAVGRLALSTVDGALPKKAIVGGVSDADFGVITQLVVEYDSVSRLQKTARTPKCLGKAHFGWRPASSACGVGSNVAANFDVREVSSTLWRAGKTVNVAKVYVNGTPMTQERKPNSFCEYQEMQFRQSTLLLAVLLS